MPFTVALLPASAQGFLHASPAHLGGLLGKAQPLETYLLADVGANPLVILVERGLVFAIIAQGGIYLGIGKGWKPTEDLLARAAGLKIRHQILNGNTARG